MVRNAYVSGICPRKNFYLFSYVLREPLAEFSGTFILVLIGTAGNAQGTLFSNGNVSTASAGVSIPFIHNLRSLP